MRERSRLVGFFTSATDWWFSFFLFWRNDADVASVTTGFVRSGLDYNKVRIVPRKSAYTYI